MRRYVVDASVVAQWYFPEEHTEVAESLLQAANIELLAPDLLHVEIASLLRDRVRLGEIDAGAAERILEALRKAPLEIKPSADLAASALALAHEDQVSLYDSFYLALAHQMGCPLLTADPQLRELPGRIAAQISWIGDLA